jgi:tetratricopeptide (TPR) repeat protein
MSSSVRALPHLAYFEAAAELDESNVEWRRVSAGLVALRLFDAWMADGAQVLAADAWSLRAVRETIAQLDGRDSTRALLTSVVDSMMLSGAPRLTMVAPKLMAYARALQFDAQWSLAADVYRSVLAHAEPGDDADVVVSANMQLTKCLRVLAEWDDALAACSTAAQVAALTGDVMSILQARINEAGIHIDRGNLPRAESILDDTIDAAQETGLSEMRAKAMHDRSTVAYHRRDHNLAIKLQHAALAITRDQLARDRLLGDLASNFVEVGLRTAARDAYLVLAATAQEQYVRWVATINLLAMAASDGSEPLFEQHRRELVDRELPPSLEAYYHLYVGRGYARFGRIKLAEAEIECCIQISERHQINQVLIEAEQSLKEIRSSGVVIIARSQPEQAASKESQDAAHMVAEMRQLAGVGA